MRPLLVRAYTATSCLGHGVGALAEALAAERGGLAPCSFETVALDTFVGEVKGVDQVRLPARVREFDCRNNRLAHLALSQDGFFDTAVATVSRVGPHRFGIFVGTSTSGILEAEIAYRQRIPSTGSLPEWFYYPGTQSVFSLAGFLRQLLGVRGPSFVVSTACSSSAKVFGCAQRMLEAGAIDAALVGGVDSLCLTTLYGFHSLQLVSRLPCRPFDRDRDGLSIGEAGAFALLTRLTEDVHSTDIALLGVGESSDAHHLSAPRPDGLGAQRAMSAAIAAAVSRPEAIDYVNLHGTATLSNDRAEGLAVREVFGAGQPASSTKGATGHTLGAAGALEAAICVLALERGFIPGGINTRDVDPDIGVKYLTRNRAQRPSRVLTNSFGFGGSNCSLVFGRLN